MIIKLVRPQEEAEFIRQAHAETLRAGHRTSHLSAIEPSPYGLHFVAYDGEDGDRPVAIAEMAFLDQVYHNFAESPFPDSLQLDRICSIDRMAGIRMLYAEPELCRRAGSRCLQLLLAGARTCWKLGARFATATTEADNAFLNRLYGKTGGRALRALEGHERGERPAAPWIFSVHSLLTNRLVRRGATGARIDVDMNTARSLRHRRAWDGGLLRA